MKIASLSPYWLQLKAAWVWLKWALVLALLISLYVKGRADGSSACKLDRAQEKSQAAEAEISRATRQANADAKRARQEAEEANRVAMEREKAALAAQARVRTLEGLLADVPGPEVCRLPDGALKTLLESMK